MMDEGIGNRIGLISALFKSQLEFAEYMDWPAPYLNRIINGKSGVGLLPIKQILDKFKDIDARWLITGEGCIFGNSAYDSVSGNIEMILRLEKYICVMSEEEQIVYRDGMNALKVEFPASTIMKWEQLYKERHGERDKIIREAIKESSKITSVSKSNGI